MHVMLDIVGSLIIRGMIVVTILRLNVSLNQTLYFKTSMANVRANLGAMVSVFETDIRQAGYGTSTPFTRADSNDIEFRGDFSNSGNVQTVRYYLEGTNIYRQYNNSPRVSVARGVKAFKLEYYDQVGILTATLSSIRSIKLTIEIEEDFEIIEAAGSQKLRPYAKSEHQFFPENL